jgi:hypothetical protein
MLCSSFKPGTLALLFIASGTLVAEATTKRGLSGLKGCTDATALNLNPSWHYNWGVWPNLPDAGGNPGHNGERICNPPMAAEYVPMLWGCYGNCTADLWPGYRKDWASIGVKALLGFNEPDNLGQSNLTPKQAAIYWEQVDDFAQTFSPPLTLVGPGMTHWDETGGSPWLDQFFGNLSDTRLARIKFLGQHDYTGSATGIIARAEAAYKRYGKKVWLTEFSVGSGGGRAANDDFLAKVLPLLDASDAVARYAWFSTRNKPCAPGTGHCWVNETYLLPPGNMSGWSRKTGHACDRDKLVFLSQHGSLDACKAKALSNSDCVEPKTAVYQWNDVKNCYCSKVPSCEATHSSWQDLYVYHGTVGQWKPIANMTCKPDEMNLLSQHKSLIECQSYAEGNGTCASSPTKTVIYEDGGFKNCYCQINRTCTKTPSAKTDMHIQPIAKNVSMELSSTGRLYSLPPTA